VRRVEALVGVDAYKFLAREHVLLNSISSLIKGSRTEELPERISELLNRVKEIEKELAVVRSAQAMGEIEGIAAAAVDIAGTSLIAKALPDGISADDLRKVAIELRSRKVQSVIALISVNEGRPVLVCAVSDAARAAGFKAGALVKIGSTILGGGGGGKDDFAQGGGTNPAKISDALKAISEALAGK
jgi:alanyl-tRNA synthetase